jgi:hypothetical protein
MTTGQFRNANEQILKACALAILPFAIGGPMYLIYLRSMNIIASDAEFVFYLIAVALMDIVLLLGIYEVLYSYKIERKPVYQIRRFLLRASLSALYLSFVLGLWYALQFYLLPSLYWKYSLLASFFVATMLLIVVVVRIPKLRDLFTRLEKGT